MPSPAPLAKASIHSLKTVRIRTPLTPLLTAFSHSSSPPSPNSNYGTVSTPPSTQDQGTTMPNSPSPAMAHPKRPLLNAALKLAVVFVVSSVLLGGTLYLAMPPLDPVDRPLLHLPRSFDDLKSLHYLLKKYKTLYSFRCVLCFVIVYFFDQAFSLPGSMYLSILAGAVWGPLFAIPLCCFCVATGASLCYLLSAALGPALLAVPKWAERVDRFKAQLDGQRANMFSYLIVLRIAPLPPHWVTNVLCPHLGVSLPFFWTTAFLGILAPTVIQVTIGGGLEQMTSPKDFHLLSLRNILSLGAIIVAALVPVVLRWVFKDRIAEVTETAAEAEVAAEGPRSPTVSLGRPYTDSPLSPVRSPRVSQEVDVSRDVVAAAAAAPRGTGLLVLLKDDDDVLEMDDEDEGGKKIAGGVTMPQEAEGSRWGWLGGWWGKGGVRLG